MGEAFISIEPDTKGFAKDLDREVSSAVGRNPIKIPVAPDTKGVSKALDGATSGFTDAGSKGASKFAGGFKSSLGGAAAAIGGAALVTQAFGFLGDSLADAIDAKKIQARVTTVINNLAPDVRGAIGKAFEGTASDISKAIAVDDDDVKAALLPLLQIPNITGPKLRELSTIASDVAAGTGKDLETVAKGVALIGQDAEAATRLLKSSGIVLDESLEENIKSLKAQGKNAEASDLVLKSLSDRFKGAGKAAGDAAGPQQRLSVAIGELRESVGNALIPILEKVTPIITKLTDYFSNLPGPVQKIIIVLAGITAALLVVAPIISAISVALPVLGAVLAALTSPIGLVVAAVVLLGVIIVKNFDTIKSVVGGVVEAVVGFFSGLLRGVTDFVRQWGILLLGPIGFIIKFRDEIGAVVGVVIGFFGRLLSGVVNFAKEWGILLLGPIGFIIKFRDEIGNAITSVVGFIIGLPGRIVSAVAALGKVGLDMGKAFLRGIVDGVSAAVGAVADIGKAVANSVIGFVNSQIIDRINSALQIEFDPPGPFPKISINPPDIPRIPTLHDGGIVPGPRGADVLINAQAGERVISASQTRRDSAAPGGPLIGTLIVQGATVEGAYTTGIETAGAIRAAQFRRTGR